MAQDLVSLFNLALQAAGVTALVSTPTENSVEAETCRLWYEPARDHVLRAAYWPSAKAVRRLGQLAERDESAVWVVSDPLPGWKYAYQQPSDLLAPRYLSTFDRFETGVYENKRAIFTNAATPILIYTKRQDDLSLWDSQLYLAIAHAVASFICMPLTGKPSRARAAAEQANSLIAAAQTSAANEANNFIDSLPSWIAAREYAGGLGMDRYYFPYGPSISSLGVSVE